LGGGVAWLDGGDGGRDEELVVVMVVVWCRVGLRGGDYPVTAVL